MARITKKALDAAQAKFLAEHTAEIEALATVEDIETRRSQLTEEHDKQIKKLTDQFETNSKELDEELALALATARESMSARKLADTLGISPTRQRTLLRLLDNPRAESESNNQASSGSHGAHTNDTSGNTHETTNTTNGAENTPPVR